LSFNKTKLNASRCQDCDFFYNDSRARNLQKLEPCKNLIKDGYCSISINLPCPHLVLLSTRSSVRHETQSRTQAKSGLELRSFLTIEREHMQFAYARVSTLEQDIAPQIDEFE
jgi:hypothetical protein